MSAPVSRMQFLRGDFKGKESPLRPPWAITESLFTEICTNCGECISQCPTHIIKQARANFPVVDFSSGECLFCEQCLDAGKTCIDCHKGIAHELPDMHDVDPGSSIGEI